MTSLQHATEADEVATSDPRPLFIAMFEAVRAYLLSEGSTEHAHARVARNPKGEATRRFDATAERIALDLARDGLGSFNAFSEEAGYITVGEGEPRWTLVLDPCDGSNNFKRGVRSVGFAVAALPVGASLDPDRVEYAVCGDIFTGAVYSAARGRGATLDGRAITASRVVDPRHAILGANIGHEHVADTAGAPTEDATDESESTPPVKTVAERMEGLWRVMRSCGSVRRTGATVLDLCYVAHGAYDAYLDLRDRLTPENFMAPALILREAGALFTTVTGGPLGTVDFTTPYSVLAAGNRDLLDALLRELA
jgi:myo-inositol-1(or 4)-monophosphatase